MKRAILCILLLLGALQAHAQGTPAPYVSVQYFENDGDVCASCKLFVYTAGTTTKVNSYSDVSLSTPNTNPIVLDSAGRATIFLTKGTAYKFVLAPSSDTDPPTSPIWTRDNVMAVGPPEIGVRAYDASAQTLANNTATAIELDTESYDDGGLHSTVSNNTRITFARAGIYAVGGTISYAADAVGIREARIRLNGSTAIATVRQSATSALAADMQVLVEYEFAAGDYVELIGMQTSGGNLDSEANGARSPAMWARFIRD